MIDKNIVAMRFARKASEYDENAVVQKKMALKLIDNLITSSGNNHYPKILEFGCGTGALTRLITGLLEFEQFYANDISPVFENNIRGFSDKIVFIGHDMEDISYFPGTMDLVISNAAFQWLNDPSGFLNNLPLKISERGLFAFSTFGPENFKEFTKLNYEGLNYESDVEIRKAFRESFNVIYSESWIETLYFPCALDVIKHIRNLGANAFGKTLTRSRLDDFIGKYESMYRDDKGVRLTYHPMLFILRRI